MLRKFIVGLALGVVMIFSALMAVEPANAQSGPLCARFAAGTAGLDNWGACAAAPNIVVTTSNVSSIGGASDYYLHLLDTAGASAACSTDERYLGDWVQKMGGCGQFCFDFKVFVSGTPPGPITPSFTIWHGTQSAVFVANFTVTANDPWRQNICAPINLIQNGDNLPSSSSGSWKIGGSNAYNVNWNAIISGVTMIQLPIDWTSNPDEEAGYDNLCMSPGGCGETPKPVVTGCFKDSKVTVKCNPDGTYTLTLSGAGFTGTDITLTSQTPGVTVVPPQQPWSATTTWTLVGASPGQTVILTANETKIGGGSKPGTDLCCSGEIKIVMPDCPKQPPIDLKIGKEEARTPSGAPPGTHWFDLTVTNAGAAFSYPANSIVVTENIPAGMNMTSATGTGWVCVPLTVVGPGASTCTYTPSGSISVGGTLPPITVKTITAGHGPWVNCAIVGVAPISGLSDSDPTNNKSCVTVGKQDRVDVAIKKTGGTSPVPQVNAYAFHLAVTNIGAAFNGSNVIVVTDVVPAGMTFNTATGPNWTCVTLPVSAGGTLTCTYTGAGPTAPNQPLGMIDITATATGSAPFPPFTNCATVGFASSSGLVDTNPSDNNSCVTVRKPTLACPAPMIPGPVAGQCICPEGTILQGQECVRPPHVCAPPMVPGPVAGQCICPQGTVQRGQDCVRPPKVCAFPMVPNTNGSTCVCPNGTVQRGNECVRPTLCKAPFISNGAGNACVCPAGLVQQGRSCVKPIVCNAPAKLNRRGACECPTDMLAKGNTCIPKTPQRPVLQPGDILKFIPGGNNNHDQGPARKGAQP